MTRSTMLLRHGWILGLMLMCTVPATTIGAGGDSWQQHDAGPFSFRLPSDMVQTNRRGIDSLVAGFDGDTCRLMYDYGIYSDSLRLQNYGGKPEFMERTLTIDSRPARLITYLEDRPIGDFPYNDRPAIPPFATPYRAAVHVADLGPSIRSTASRPVQNRLTMVVGCQDPAERDRMMAIFHSIEFDAATPLP